MESEPDYFNSKTLTTKLVIFDDYQVQFSLIAEYLNVLHDNLSFTDHIGIISITDNSANYVPQFNLGLMIFVILISNEAHSTFNTRFVFNF